MKSANHVSLRHVEDIVTCKTDHERHAHRFDNAQVPPDEPKHSKHGDNVVDQRKRPNEGDAPVANEDEEGEKCNERGGNEIELNAFDHGHFGHHARPKVS